MQGVGMSSSPKTRLNISVTTPSYLATLSIRAITLFATSEKDFVFMLFEFGRG